MSPKSPKLLLYYSQLNVYHYLYNIIELIQRNSFWYCFWNKTLGCEKNGQKVYCLLCMLEMYKKYDTYELGKIKKCPLELLFFTECVFDNLKKIADFDKSIVELWSGDVPYRGRDYGEETEWQVYLRDLIEFRFEL